MLKPKTVSVDGEEYTLGHWDVKRSLETWAWLLEALGDGVKGMLSLVLKDAGAPAPDGTLPLNKTALDAELALEAFGHLVSTLRQSVPSDVYAERMLSFCSDVIHKSGKVDARFFFQGKLLHMHKVVVEVLRFQYADFLDEALSLLK